MTEFEWPPDEIAGPAGEDSKAGKARASAPVPLAGVPISTAGPQTGVPLSAPQPLDPTDPLPRRSRTSDSLFEPSAGMPRAGLPVPPQRQGPAVPLNASKPIPVEPHTAPIPLDPPRPPSLSELDDEPVPIPAPLLTTPPLPPPRESAFFIQSQADDEALPEPSYPALPSTLPSWQAPSTQVTPSVSHIPIFSPNQDEVYLPTAEEFARRRALRPPDPVAHSGIQATIRKATFGLLNLSPGQKEQELRRQTDLVRRNFGGLRQVTVVNPKGGAGKTVAVLLLAMTFGRKRGGYVLAWDNNETQGTLGMRSQQDFHSRTVRDLLRDLPQFQGVNSRVGDLSQYVRAQGDGMFEVLASDESATAGEMLTAEAFAEIREVVSRFYKLIIVDTGNNVRAENWQAAIDATDQLVITMSARNDSAETAARMLDHLEQTGRQRLVRQAVSIVSMPPSRKELDIPAIERHFAARTRTVRFAPYERMIDTGEPIDYSRLGTVSQDSWLSIAAAVAEGL